MWMIRLCKVVPLAVVTSAAAVVFLVPGIVQAANIRLDYLPPQGPREIEVHAFLQRSKLLNDISQAVTMSTDLPVSVTIRLGSMGPYYDPLARTISIPYAMQLLPESGTPSPESAERDHLYEGAITFVICHEIGHALIDLFKLSSGDRSEEDLADALALYLSVNLLGRREAVLEALAEQNVEPPQQSSGEPARGALNPARRESLICHLEGAQAKQGAGIEGAVADARHRECSEAYAGLAEMVERLLEPHRKSP